MANESQSTVGLRDDDFEHDLHPEHDAGIHAGIPQYRTRTAFDYKDLHETLKEYRDDELKQMPVVVEGERLEQGATYVDLAHPETKPFVASGDSEAGPGSRYVSKRDVDYLLWNRLTGVTDPNRLDQAS